MPVPKGESPKPKGDLASRTKAFALRIIRVYESLPKSVTAQVLGKQALRAGTSVGAHYREACRGRSRAEFTSRAQVGLQELEETKYWLELLVEAQIVPQTKLSHLLDEAEELTAMLVASVTTAKKNRTLR